MRGRKARSCIWPRRDFLRLTLSGLAGLAGANLFTPATALAADDEYYIFLPQAFMPGIEKATEEYWNLKLAWTAYKESDYRQALADLKTASDNVKTQEPAFWVLLGLVDNARTVHRDDWNHYTNEEIKHKENELKKNKPVYHFAQGMNTFRAIWLPNLGDYEKIEVYGGSLKKCQEIELDFLKGMFASVRLNNYEKVAKDFINMAPEKAKEYFVENVQPILKGDEITTQQKWWYAWNVAGLISHQCHMYFNYDVGEKRSKYGNTRVKIYNDPFEENLIKNKITPKVHEYDVYGNFKKYKQASFDLREINLADR